MRCELHWLHSINLAQQHSHWKCSLCYSKYTEAISNIHVTLHTILISATQSDQCCSIIIYIPDNRQLALTIQKTKPFLQTKNTYNMNNYTEKPRCNKPVRPAMSGSCISQVVEKMCSCTRL